MFTPLFSIFLQDIFIIVIIDKYIIIARTTSILNPSEFITAVFSNNAIISPLNNPTIKTKAKTIDCAIS